MFTYDLTTLPLVTMTGKFMQKKGLSHASRTLDVNLLVYIHSGSVTFVISGKKFAFNSGDVCLVPKNTPYSAYSDVDYECTFFHFGGELSLSGIVQCQKSESGLFYGVISSSSPVIPLDNKISLSSNKTEVELLLHKCANLPKKFDSKIQLMLSIRLSETLILISQDAFGDNVSAAHYPQAVKKMIGFIQSNYRSKLTLSDIAAEVGVSKQYCMRAFKKATGVSIAKYIISIKMNHAAYLLRWTYMNVNETADYLGFSSTSYFSRTFTAFYGVPPSEYLE